MFKCKISEEKQFPTTVQHVSLGVSGQNGKVPRNWEEQVWRWVHQSQESRAQSGSSLVNSLPYKIPSSQGLFHCKRAAHATAPIPYAVITAASLSLALCPSLSPSLFLLINASHLVVLWDRYRDGNRGSKKLIRGSGVHISHWHHRI